MGSRTRAGDRPSRRWSIRETHRNIHIITITLRGSGDEQRVLCQSDAHWDNPMCNRDMMKAHLDEALALDAPVIDNGDWFCVMQGKWDKRANKSDLRPEHQRADYLDALVETSAAYLKPYERILTIRGQGNHERSILTRHETNLTERLVERLRAGGAPHVYLGGYSGFIVFQIQHDSTCRRPFKMHYHHGHGGGGAVTRGVIQTNRHAVFLSDADFVWTGHTHDSWQVPIARVRLNGDCSAVEHTRQVHFRTPGYKEEYGSGYGGWHVERGAAPKPTGAAWLVFRQTRNKVIDYDIIEAK